jgi:NADH-quinone oxidoreductase subunit F
MLVQTIPAYRLPREILAREIRMIEGMGVTIETGKQLGKDFTLMDLKHQGYEAVFLGVGSPVGLSLNLPGINAEGVIDALHFLRTYNLRGSVPVKKKIVVVGGGNAAIDTARTAIRLGAGEVRVIYRRSQDEMPAYAEEIDEALEEGIMLYTLTNPLEILTSKGKVTGVKCNTNRLGAFDASGRRKPEAEEKTFVIEAEQVIMAIGSTLNCDEIFSGLSIETRQNGTVVKINPENGQTSVPWIFAGGDSATGPMTVIKAVAGGEKAAAGIDEYLTGANHAFWRKEKKTDTFFDPDADPIALPRQKITLLSAERRKHNFDEVEQVWVESEAIRQAHRCLRCDYGKN